MRLTEKPTRCFRLLQESDGSCRLWTLYSFGPGGGVPLLLDSLKSAALSGPSLAALPAQSAMDDVYGSIFDDDWDVDV